MSELFVAVHFSVAANEESRKREQEKRSRGKRRQGAVLLVLVIYFLCLLQISPRIFRVFLVFSGY